MSPRKILSQAHWLIGITVGIVLAIVGVTGALLSFEPQIVAFVDRDRRYFESSEAVPLAAPQLLARIAAANPEQRIIGLSVGREAPQFVRVTFAPREGGDSPGVGRGRGEQRYVDPQTGAVLATAPSAAETFFRNVRQLHRWLMLGELGNRDVGRQIVGASTLLLILVALTGLYLRWPRGSAVRSLRVWLVPNFRLKGRAFLWNLHSVAGTWVLPVYLIVALTGLQWSYEWYRNGLYAIAGVEQRAQRQPAAADAAEPARSQAIELTPAWNAFTGAVGDRFSAVNVNLAAGAQPIEFRYLDPHPPHDRAFNALVIDQHGAPVRHERYENKKIGARLISSIFPLHSGSYFGIAGVVAFLLASLAMPVFTVTGWIMYVQRRAPRRHRASVAAAGGSNAGTEIA